MFEKEDVYVASDAAVDCVFFFTFTSDLVQGCLRWEGIREVGSFCTPN